MASIELEPGCKKLDKALAKYYQNLNREHEYYPDGVDGDSIFAKWVEDNGNDDDTLSEEFEDDPTQSSVIEFHVDENDKKLFPLLTNPNNEKKRNLDIFNVMKYCYIYGVPPQNNVEVEDLDLNIDNEQIEEITNIYNQQIPDIMGTVSKEPDVMYYLSVTRKNNDFPVLPTIVDCYTRYRLEQIQNKQTEIEYKPWIELNQALKAENDNKERENKLENAMKGYAHRICPRFQFTTLTAIDDSVSDIANYVAATSQFIKVLLEKTNGPTPPFQVDLCIAVKHVITTAATEMPEGKDDDDDQPNDQEPETATATALIGDVHAKLKHEKCQFVEQEIDDIELLQQRRILPEQFDEFKKQLQKTNVKGFNRETYPHSKRFVIFIDRKGGGKDKITFFDPPSVCNTIPKNHVPEWYFESARKCFIPRKGFGDGSKEQENKPNEEKEPDNITLNAQKGFGGKMISFSFHVDSVNKIKCYLFWNGQAMRFYPQDINDAFQFIFDKARFRKFRSNKNNVNDVFKRIHIKDEQYEWFYRSLCKEKNKTNFPKKSIY